MKFNVDKLWANDAKYMIKSKFFVYELVIEIVISWCFLPGGPAVPEVITMGPKIRSWSRKYVILLYVPFSKRPPSRHARPPLPPPGNPRSALVNSWDISFVVSRE